MGHGCLLQVKVQAWIKQGIFLCLVTTSIATGIDHYPGRLRGCAKHIVKTIMYMPMHDQLWTGSFKQISTVAHKRSVYRVVTIGLVNRQGRNTMVGHKHAPFTLCSKFAECGVQPA